MLKVLRKLWFVISLLLAGHAFGGLRDAPLPDDLFVTEPAPGVPDASKPFAGKWTGLAFLASVDLPHVVVIERLEPTLAWAVWSMGLTQYAGGAAAWYRIPMRVQADHLIAYIPGGEMRYRLVSNDELTVEGTRFGYLLKGTLKREAMATQPYTTEDPPTYWPWDIQRLQPGKSAVPNAAVFSDSTIIQPAGENLPDERAKWLGKWSGWACESHSCDIKLAVLDVTSDRAHIVQLFTSKDWTPNQSVREAAFVGGELRLRGGGYRSTYRMRPDGIVEAFYVGPSGSMSWGVMTKEP